MILDSLLQNSPVAALAAPLLALAAWAVAAAIGACVRFVRRAAMRDGAA